METLLKILDELTAMTIDKDLFAYEIPLGASGAWLMDTGTQTRHNSVDAKEFSIYYRAKSKQSAMKNIDYLKNTIDTISEDTCTLSDGTNFRLDILGTWDYLEKDTEGYFVFANRLRLVL